MISLLNQMSAGGGAELCAPLIAKYQSIHNAPTYDVSGQSNDAQQAYGAYRDGINLVDQLGEKVLSCGQGGGPIGALNIGVILASMDRAVRALSQAQDVIRLAPGVSTLSPLEEAIERALRAIGGVEGVMNKLMPNQSTWFGGGVPANDPRCVEALTWQNAIPTFTMDPTGQPESVQSAYQLYQEALNIYQLEVSDFPRACMAGEVTVAPVGFPALWARVGDILVKLRQAQAALK
jgi:hypothetical protein